MAAELAHRNRDRAKAMRREVDAALKQCEKRIFITAQSLSSGPVKTATLSQAPPGLNHPYGLGLSNRRGPRGSVPNSGNAGIINEQTGDFKASWDTTRFAGTAYANIVLFNYSEHAKFIAGANLGIPGLNTQIPRPILQEIHRIEDPLFIRDMADAFRRALRKP